MKRVLLGLLFVLASSGMAQTPDTPKKDVSAVTKKVPSKTALVFVQKADSTWEPRMVQVGISDWDYTEVISGLKEGERVALLSAALLQAKREASNEAMSQRLGTSSPLGAASSTRP